MAAQHELKMDGGSVWVRVPVCFTGDRVSNGWMEVAKVLDPGDQNPGLAFTNTFGARLVTAVAAFVLGKVQS